MTSEERTAELHRLLHVILEGIRQLEGLDHVEREERRLARARGYLQRVADPARHRRLAVAIERQREHADTLRDIAAEIPEEPPL